MNKHALIFCFLPELKLICVEIVKKIASLVMNFFSMSGGNKILEQTRTLCESDKLVEKYASLNYSWVSL